METALALRQPCVDVLTKAAIIRPVLHGSMMTARTATLVPTVLFPHPRNIAWTTLSVSSTTITETATANRAT
jgi:hypothetical protein